MTPLPRRFGRTRSISNRDAAETVVARRVLLCCGMLDELPAIDGFAELWGRPSSSAPIATVGKFEIAAGDIWREGSKIYAFLCCCGAGRATSRSIPAPPSLSPGDAQVRLSAAGIRIETSPIARLVAHGEHLQAVALENARRVPCEILFVHPRQDRLPSLTRSASCSMTTAYVRVDPSTRETSVPGVYAAGDLTTRMQGAVLAAAYGAQAAAMLNHELTSELVTAGVL